MRCHIMYWGTELLMRVMQTAIYKGFFFFMNLKNCCCHDLFFSSESSTHFQFICVGRSTDQCDETRYLPEEEMSISFQWTFVPQPETAWLLAANEPCRSLQWSRLFVSSSFWALATESIHSAALLYVLGSLYKNKLTPWLTQRCHRRVEYQLHWWDVTARKNSLRKRMVLEWKILWNYAELQAIDWHFDCCRSN